jgi:hypothetical protein
VTDGKIKLKATICCIVCSRVSERPLMAAEGEGIVICPHCLAEGDIDAKLERQAARLESRSRWLRALIGRLEVPPPTVLKEFAGPEDTEQAAFLWDSLSNPPPIKSDAEVDPEPGKALAAALAKRREYGYRVTFASGTLCPHCSRSLRVTAVRHIDESGFDIICESCHADIIRAERREAGWSHGPGTMTMRFIEHAPELVLLGPSNHLMRA